MKPVHVPAFGLSDVGTNGPIALTFSSRKSCTKITKGLNTKNLLRIRLDRAFNFRNPIDPVRYLYQIV